jgi:hypothetical protein
MEKLYGGWSALDSVVKIRYLAHTASVFVTHATLTLMAARRACAYRARMSFCVAMLSSAFRGG